MIDKLITRENNLERFKLALPNKLFYCKMHDASSLSANN